MTISFLDFIGHFTSNIQFFITVVLVLATIFVNGWHDASNAIATVVATRSMSAKSAIVMAAVFNFLGVFIMTSFSSSVAQTIYKMVDFGGDPHSALLALCAALFAIVVWSVVTWYYGLPSSASHALIAGLTGGAIAIHGGLDAVNGAEWIKVVYGLLISAILGFGGGYAVSKIVSLIFKAFDRRKTLQFFHGGQIVAGALLAFMHGAHDGQKFMSVFLLGCFLAEGNANVSSFVIPIWLMVLCSLVMALGTSLGGYRIIKSVGMNMVHLETWEGFSACVSASALLFYATITGIPMSTTQSKTTCIMGVGAAKRLSNVNWPVAGNMVLTWVLTFPGCGLIGYLMVKLAMLFI